MALNTAITVLEYCATVDGVYASLVAIVNYPDMGATPSKLDTTDLSQETFKTSILGLQDIPDLVFECNYDEAVYATIEALAGTVYWFHLDMGTASEDGRFQWSGKIQIYANGAGVDEVRKMTVVLSAETEMTFAVV